MRVATIIKYLKRFTGIILLIIVLLIIQALTDLALPQYTSDIVDIGIQQNGIKEIAPKVIRESELNKLILFMDDEDKNYVDDNYTLIVKENLPEIDYEKYLKVYPELKNTPLYKENLINDRESQERLDEIFTKPITIVENIENNREMSEGLEKVIVENMPEGMVGDNMNVFQLLGILPKDVRDNIVEKINGNFNNMPQTLLSQAGISYVKNEYKAIGIDTDKEQINYIFNSGIKMIGLALIGGISIVLVSFLHQGLQQVLQKY